MEADSYGGFAIVARLGVALQSQPFKHKREAILSAFLSRYSTKGSDVLVLLKVLMCLDAQSSADEGESTSRTISVDELAAFVAKKTEASSISKLKYASGGSLPLSAAADFVATLRAAFLSPEKNGSDLPADRIRAVAAQCSAREFETLLLVAAGNSSAVAGLTKLEEVLEAISPAAAFALKTNGNDLQSAIDLACAGSPNAALERDPTITSDPCLMSSDVGYDSSSEGANLPRVAGVKTAPGGPVEDRSPAKLTRQATGSMFRKQSDRSPSAPAMGEGGGITLLPPSDASSPFGPVVGIDEAPVILEDAAPGGTATGEGGRGEDSEDARPTKKHRTKTMCRYGIGCKRKNPDHFAQYDHPPDHPCHKTAASAVKEGREKVRDTCPSVTAAPAAKVEPKPSDHAINGVSPARVMPEHEFVFVDGVTGTHKMKNCGDGTYTCSCPVWRFQVRAANERTCKHLQQYLGEDFERARCSSGDASDGIVPATAGKKKAAGGAATGAAGKKHPMPGVLLANKADLAKGYDGWLCSEKLDGVRAYWDGQRFISRNGNEFTAPDWFTAALPKDVTLDGELFGGRKKFQSTVGIVKSSPAHPGWKTLRYEVFDIPSSGSKPFEVRVEEMNALLAGKGEYVHVVEHTKCTGKEFIDEELRKVEALGGEGLMLREPGSRYVHSRSNTLLKVKSTEEVDALVKGYDAGKGKHTGRCGALLCELPNGKQFAVGSGLSDAQRAKPPPIGTVVCVRFQELTDGGVPRFPVFGGCRYDIDWPPKDAATVAGGKKFRT